MICVIMPTDRGVDRVHIRNAYIFTGGSFQKGDIRFSERISEIGDLSGKADIDAGGGQRIWFCWTEG